MQHCSIPQVLVRSHVDSLLLNASQTMNDCLGTSWENQTSFLQGTFCFLVRIWFQVWEEENPCLYSWLSCLQRTLSLPDRQSKAWTAASFAYISGNLHCPRLRTLQPVPLAAAATVASLSIPIYLIPSSPVWSSSLPNPSQLSNQK